MNVNNSAYNECEKWFAEHQEPNPFDKASEVLGWFSDYSNVAWESGSECFCLFGRAQGNHPKLSYLVRGWGYELQEEWGTLE